MSKINHISWKGKLNPKWTPFKKSSKCVQCGKEFYREQGGKIYSTDKRTKYCSRKCYYNSKKGIIFYAKKLEEHPMWKGGWPKCIDCGIVLKNRYAKRCQCCSHKRMTGENSPRWKGGITKHPKYRCLKNRKRLFLKRGNGGNHSVLDWENLKAQYNWTCSMCNKKEPFIELTEDHIVPFVKGGTNNINNIQPLCRSCNSKKGIKIIKFMFNNLVPTET